MPRREAPPAASTTEAERTSEKTTAHLHCCRGSGELFLGGKKNLRPCYLSDFKMYYPATYSSVVDPRGGGEQAPPPP